jgi:Zn-dependent M28 family amino/carboxypeptidase
MRLKANLFFCFAIFLFTFFSGCSQRKETPPPKIDSALAWSLTCKLVAFGPRPSGSSANYRQIDFIENIAREFGAETSRQSFIDNTPKGKMKFVNVIAEIKGEREDFIVIGTHFDTKVLELLPDFVGANDGASSTALALAMIKAVSDSGRKPFYSLRFVFFDGEECFMEYNDNDGLFGSKHYVESLKDGGALERCKAAVILDMIGDKDLKITLPVDSHSVLFKAVMDAAGKERSSAKFSKYSQSILDDHMPFQRLGVPAIDIIDFEFGPSNSYWHTKADNLENISEESIGIVGNVALRLIWNLHIYL